MKQRHDTLAFEQGPRDSAIRDPPSAIRFSTPGAMVVGMGGFSVEGNVMVVTSYGFRDAVADHDARQAPPSSSPSRHRRIHALPPSLPVSLRQPSLPLLVSPSPPPSPTPSPGYRSHTTTVVRLPSSHSLPPSPPPASPPPSPPPTSHS